MFLAFYRDAEQIKELKGNLKKAQAELKERSLLLDMYKTCTKETRDKVAPSFFLIILINIFQGGPDGR